ncbi:hypothetical protein ACFQH6_04685 [Halobacteriaceae archaeon GCM10025711]
MLTILQIGQLATAAAIPASLFVVMNQIRDVVWTRLAPAIVVNVALAVGLLASAEIIPHSGRHSS